MLAIWSLVPLPRLNPSVSGSFWFLYFWTLLWMILSITLLAMWNECNCAVVSTFFHTALLWDLNENWSFPGQWPLLSFSNLLAYWVQHFNSTIWQTGLCFLPHKVSSPLKRSSNFSPQVLYIPESLAEEVDSYTSHCQRKKKNPLITEGLTLPNSFRTVWIWDPLATSLIWACKTAQFPQ